VTGAGRAFPRDAASGMGTEAGPQSLARGLRPDAPNRGSIGAIMKLKMAENSLFAILLRSPWWISFVIAAGVATAATFFMPGMYAVAVAFPFIAIGTFAGWRQLRAPSGARIAAAIEALRGMSWDEFSSAIEAAFRRDGYAVNRLTGTAADFELTKAGRVTLVGCKRWKTARAGIEPLRELHAAGQARDAHQCMLVAAGDITANARAFAAEKRIRLLEGAELASLLPLAGRSKKGSSPAGVRET
jgi:restriction system protein